MKKSGCRVPRFRLALFALLFALGCVPRTAKSPIATETPSSAPSKEASCEGDCFGPLHLGIGAGEIEALLGTPGERGEGVLEEATGLVVSRWSYPARGLELFVASDEETKTEQLIRFIAKAPSPLATNRGTKIGSTRAEVRRAYSERLASDAPGSESEIVDSIYGGIVFSFEADRVSEIFFGAAAE